MIYIYIYIPAYVFQACQGKYKNDYCQNHRTLNAQTIIIYKFTPRPLAFELANTRQN